VRSNQGERLGQNAGPGSGECWLRPEGQLRSGRTEAALARAEPACGYDVQERPGLENPSFRQDVCAVLARHRRRSHLIHAWGRGAPA